MAKANWSRLSRGLCSSERGSIVLQGQVINSWSIHRRIEAGIGHIPEDRHKRGLVLDYSIEDNMVLETYGHEPYSHYGFLQPKAIHAHAEDIARAFDVRCGKGVLSIARSLSGGNQQKAIVGREIDRDPILLIAVQPTRGLDVGSIEYIHKRLIEHRDRGRAVLLVSLELDEILDLSDRIAVINHGELVGVVDAAHTDENEIGLMMAGIGNNKEVKS